MNIEQEEIDERAELNTFSTTHGMPLRKRHRADNPTMRHVCVYCRSSSHVLLEDLKNKADVWKRQVMWDVSVCSTILMCYLHDNMVSKPFQFRVITAGLGSQDFDPDDIVDSDCLLYGLLHLPHVPHILGTVFLPDAKQVLIMDSIECDIAGVKRATEAFMEHHFGSTSDWKFVYDENSVRQRDTVSCGVFATAHILRKCGIIQMDGATSTSLRNDLLDYVVKNSKFMYVSDSIRLLTPQKLGCQTNAAMNIECSSQECRDEQCGNQRFQRGYFSLCSLFLVCDMC